MDSLSNVPDHTGDLEQPTDIGIDKGENDKTKTGQIQLLKRNETSGCVEQNHEVTTTSAQLTTVLMIHSV